MKTYTKTGDAGLTSLYIGERVEKNSLRVHLRLSTTFEKIFRPARFGQVPID